MQLLRAARIEDPAPCPYLPGRQRRYESFLATGLDPAELSALLAAGWRKFGPYFFRPACAGCRACIPLRVPAAAFVPSRSQRRVLRRSAGLGTVFAPLRFSERAFAIYREHSRQRFAQETDLEEFLFNFYLPSGPSRQTELYRDGEMVAVGFLDQGEDCLSSVYFAFDPRHAGLGLGTFGALAEIGQARRLGLAWYYLGYYVAGCPAMAYKDRFRPRQHYDWESGMWHFPLPSP